jgi:hypothetical protein
MFDVPTKPGRVLHFDCEARPLSFWQPDQPTTEITAISSAWADDIAGTIETSLLGEHTQQEMLAAIVARWNEATVVTAHYGLRYDAPLINGALIEYNMGTLEPKLFSDTKEHLVKFKFIPKTQEHLSDMMGTFQTKEHMRQSQWREANRLTTEGLQETRRRVEGDIYQHYELRQELLKRGLLGPPTLWTP